MLALAKRALRFEAMIFSSSALEKYTTRFSNGEHEGLADTTRDKGGSQSGFRPHDLLEAALATCINMYLRMYAQTQQFPLEHVEVRVELDRSQSPEDALFRYEIELKGALTDKQRQKLLRVAQACPVRKTLSRKIRFEATEQSGH